MVEQHNKIKKMYIINECITSFNNYVVGYTFVYLFNIVGLAYLLSYQTLCSVCVTYFGSRFAKYINKYESKSVLKISLLFEVFSTLLWIFSLSAIIINEKLVWLNLVGFVIYMLTCSVVGVKGERMYSTLFKTPVDRTNFLSEKTSITSMAMIAGVIVNLILVTVAEFTPEYKLLVYKGIISLHTLLCLFDFYVSYVEYNMSINIVETLEDNEYMSYTGMKNLFKNFLTKV